MHFSHKVSGMIDKPDIHGAIPRATLRVVSVVGFCDQTRWRNSAEISHLWQLSDLSPEKRKTFAFRAISLPEIPK